MGFSGVWARSLAWMAAWCVPTIRSCPSFRWPGRRQSGVSGIARTSGRSKPWVSGIKPGETHQSWGSRIPSAQFQLKKKDLKATSQPVLELSAQLRVAIRQMQTLHPFFVGVERLVSWGAQLVWKPVGHGFNGRPPHHPFDETFPNSFGETAWNLRLHRQEILNAMYRHAEVYILFKYVPSINSQEVSNMSSNTWND